MYALVDCNNFFVSCERVFRPDLWYKPVAVLSNNDGCLVSRSQEVKDLGVPMGAPYFKWRDVLTKNNVHIFSANFSLYGDMSHRVMNVLEELSSDIEIYSIDEAFLIFHNQSGQEIKCYGTYIRDYVFQATGMPISVGIAPTKTLAKLGSYLAKKKFVSDGACYISDAKDYYDVLQNISVQEVWGIGRKLTKKLLGYNIRSIYDLLQKDVAWVKRMLGTAAYFHVLELHGQPCIQRDHVTETRKNITSSRSFGKAVTTKKELQEALAKFVSIAAEKLRRQNSLASYMQVYVRTNRFKQESFYGNYAAKHLGEPTSYTPFLIKQSHQLLDTIYRDDCLYKKAGIIFSGLVSNQKQQLNLFDLGQVQRRARQDSLMHIMDSINMRWGSGTMYYMAQGIRQPWQGKRNLVSQQYTTKWDQILEISI